MGTSKKDIDKAYAKAIVDKQTEGKQLSESQRAAALKAAEEFVKARTVHNEDRRSHKR